MLKHPLEIYLEELAALRVSWAAMKETSGYPALANLLNSIGQTLKPKVRCFIQLKNSGAGVPDGGVSGRTTWEIRAGSRTGLCAVAALAVSR